MITTFTLNAAVDKVHYIENFHVEKVNRVSEVISEPGGKGNNVAKVVHLLGADVVASGFLGGDTGRYVHETLLERGIVSDPVWVTGQTREALNIIDRSEGTLTEILEPGPVVTQSDWEEIQTKVKMLAKKSRLICFSGSLPRGLPADAYAKLIEIAKATGALTILDSSGDSLSRGIESLPFMCKPNRDELALLTGKRSDSLESIIAVTRGIVEKGVELVVVSLDKEGSLVVSENGACQVLPPKIEAVNTVGCGDALVGGIASYLDQLGEKKPSSLKMIEAVAWGTAAAASNALYPIAGHVNVKEVTELLKRVTIKHFY